MIYLPGLKRWINLDLVQHAGETMLSFSSGTGFELVFGFSQGYGNHSVYVKSQEDRKIVEEALNARCAEEAGEAFLP